MLCFMIDGLTPQTIERRIRAYESFGVHRTGWLGDDQAAGWMAGELSKLGIDAQLEHFLFPRVEVRSTVVTWPDGSVNGLPLYDGGFTPPGGIEGQLVVAGDPEIFAKIVVAPPDDPAFSQRTIYETVEELQAAGAIGLVVPRGDPQGEVTVLNAERIDTPLSLPVLQIASGSMGDFTTSALLGMEARLEIDGDRLQSRAANVVASLAGSDPDAQPVGIMTPRSGWFTCAAERGGGIAILLGLAEAIMRIPERKRSVHFLASSGHELNHYGLKSYLTTRPGIEERAVAWLHLGANIGSSTGPTTAESLDSELHALADAALAAEGANYEMIDTRGGEAVNIAEAGGRYVSIRGTNAFFHSPNDVFEKASDAAEVAAAGRAAVRIVKQWLA